jgi:hypothetical protein
MTTYRRPEIPKAIYVDGAGMEIHYGSRWGDGSPPEETYSVTSNLERFRPLATISDALIDWLESSFDVEVDESVSNADDLIHHRDDVVRAVRVRPRRSDAAPLTFVYTSFPSVIVHAGALHDFLFPVCGCDACDEHWEPVADDLEWTVVTVTAGGYSERIENGRGAVHFWLRDPVVRTSAGTGRAEDYPADRENAARRSIPEGPWARWPSSPHG